MSILPILLGYLLGSFLPAYFLTKLTVGVDIRTVGTMHAGTTNVKRIAGTWPAVLTALYDTTKGIIAMHLSLMLGADLVTSYAAALAAIAGHVFPLYLGFKGGKGAATTVGLLLFFLWKTGIAMPSNVVIADLSILASVVGIVAYITRRGDVVGVFCLPALGILLVMRNGIGHETVFCLILISILIFINVRNILQGGLLVLTGDIRAWRVLIRPAAILLPLLSFYLSKGRLLLLIGIVLATFFATDLVRLISRRVNTFFAEEMKFRVYKDRERKQLSSMTLFLVSNFICFAFFSQSVAFVTLCFLIFGDMAAKIIGISYGKRKLFEKTAEGTLTHFAVCLFIAYVTYLVGWFPFLLLLAGAVVATVVEALPLSVNDNISVPIFTGIVLSLPQIF
ncbi:MAG: glycerol-3-phosphate acyltransferase [Thermotogaceae bacterium]|nr:glycerol-3-phosphate acyltransferase [Thermotogaceae bacterium]